MAAPETSVISVLLRGEGDGAPVSRCTLKASHLASKPVRFLLKAFCKTRAGLDPEVCVATRDGATWSPDAPLAALRLVDGAAVVVKRRPTTPPLLVVFATCERDSAVVRKNVAFFLEHGVRRAAGHGSAFRVCVVANGGAAPYLRAALAGIAPPPTLVERENAGGDFAAWGAGLDACWVDGESEAVVCLNDTVRGPVVPRFVAADAPWPALFAARLDARVKLVGPTVNRMANWEPRFRSPHVQSMAFATDAAGLALLRAAAIFAPERDAETLVASCGALRRGLVVPGEQRRKVAYVFQHEIRMSELVRAAGFEILGFQLAETTGKFPMDDVQLDYGGAPLSPVETLFVKASHSGFDTANPLVDRYTRWLDGDAPARRKVKIGRAA